MKTGDKCTINGYGDLYMEVEARPFIGQPCEIVKITKAGLIMVRLIVNPKMVYSFARRNVDLEVRG